MRKIILFLDELKPVSPEYKEQMTAFILQRAILNRAAERMARIRQKSKLPEGWKISSNRDVVIETEPDINQWIEHLKDK